MKYLKKIFESNIFEINSRILDDIECIQGLIDDVDERYGHLCKCHVFVNSSKADTTFRGNLTEFSNWMKTRLEVELPTIQYTISETISNMKFDDEYLIDSLQSLKSRLSNTDCRIDQISVNTTSKYLEQFSPHGLNKKPINGAKHTEYDYPYSISKEKEIKFGLGMTNLKVRYK